MQSRVGHSQSYRLKPEPCSLRQFVAHLCELVEVSPLKYGGGKIRWALFHPGIPKATLILSVNVIIEGVGELES